MGCPMRLEYAFCEVMQYVPAPFSILQHCSRLDRPKQGRDRPEDLYAPFTFARLDHPGILAI